MADVIKTLLRVLRKFETDGEDEIRPEEVAFVKAGLTACVKRSNNNDVDLVEDCENFKFSRTCLQCFGADPLFVTSAGAITELELEILSDVRSASGYYASKSSSLPSLRRTLCSPLISFAVVKKARWRSTQVVAVKILAERLSNRDVRLPLTLKKPPKH